MDTEQAVALRNRSSITGRGLRISAGQRWTRAVSGVAAVALLVACGSDGGSESDGANGSSTPSATETAAPAATEPAAPAETDPVVTSDEPAPPASTEPVDEPSSGVGLAVVDVDGARYEFMVIQCLRDVASPISDAVIEFQLDGVPAATPPEVVERLLGAIDAGDDVLGELEPVVEFGPILSVTRLAGGGELVSITDLDSIEISSDGDPTDPASRSLDVSDDAFGATVTGSTGTTAGLATVDATCP
jgi:hypothetical protein